MSTKPKVKSSKKVAATKSSSIIEEELMRSVGVRELRQQASRVLEIVKNGEVIVVTERGRPIAEIVPIKKSKYQILVDSGAITPALQPFDPEVWNRKDGPTYPDALEEFLKERHEARY
jgi:prevent-host-death family protein